MPNLWSLPLRWENIWIKTSKERPSLTWVAPACLVRPHTDVGSNHVSSAWIIQRKVLCKQCSSSGSNSHFAVALAKSSFFHISFATVQAYRHTQFWLPYYTMNPHMVLDQSFYCHGPFSPLKKGIRYPSRYSTHIPLPRTGPWTLSTQFCELQNYFHGTESPSGSFNSA